jgi:hypothetical protein
MSHYATKKSMANMTAPRILLPGVKEFLFVLLSTRIKVGHKLRISIFKYEKGGPTENTSVIRLQLRHNR